ncbi:MAG TPA: Zeta toxin family protein, partial [Bacteroidetes bacterium]|nr:Zeta toxin family protein [Bacteroidota bacterium]
LALARIEDRVKKGGHNIPNNVVIRRYTRSLENLVNIFIPICNEWSIFDNSTDKMNLIAEGTRLSNSLILDNQQWEQIYAYKS